MLGLTVYSCVCDKLMPLLFSLQFEYRLVSSAELLMKSWSFRELERHAACHFLLPL